MTPMTSYSAPVAPNLFSILRGIEPTVWLFIGLISQLKPLTIHQPNKISALKHTISVSEKLRHHTPVQRRISARPKQKICLNPRPRRLSASRRTCLSPRSRPQPRTSNRPACAPRPARACQRATSRTVGAPASRPACASPPRATPGTST